MELKKRFYLSLVVLCILTKTTLCYADMFDKAEKAGTEFGKWFKLLLKPYKDIGIEGQREHFVGELRDLNREMFRLEQEKRYMIIILQRKSLSMAEINDSLSRLSNDVNRVQAVVGEIGPDLRLQYREGGFAAAKQLTDAITERKQWVSDLDQEIREHKNINVESYIADAKKAIEALSNADEALVKLIDALQQENDKH
jgi:hypothetical protein